MTIIVSAGAGFIEANFLNPRVPRHPEHQLVTVDSLTYEVNLGSVQATARIAEAELAVAWDDPATDIEWPVDDPLMSRKDPGALRLSDLGKCLPMWPETVR